MPSMAIVPGPDNCWASKRLHVQEACSEIFNQFGYSIASGRCLMRNQDAVSGGFLALTTASLVLLCSSLLAFALT
jgi:hypothetical protein